MLHPEIKARIQLIRPTTILDFGCGRGDEVAELLDAGYDAYGYDVTSTEVSKGRALFASTGRDPNRLMDRLPRRKFDFVFTQQVLEHVPDLNSAAAELAEVARGPTFHTFPARFRPIENHYGLPLVHWLPKNRLRLYALRILYVLGFGRQNVAGRVANADFTYRYSCEQTFYRPLGEVVRVFEQHGFAVAIECDRNRRLASLPGCVRRAAGWLFQHFASVNLACNRVAARPPDPPTPRQPRQTGCRGSGDARGTARHS